MINIALIGAGGHSIGAHAPALQLAAQRGIAGVRLAAICDLDLKKAEQAAKQFGFVRAYASVDELFSKESRIDALVNVLPIPAMLKSTPDLLRRGVPMMIEKPLGKNIAEARALAEMILSQHAADRVMISFNRRFDPGLCAGVKWAMERGPLRYVRGTMVRALRAEPTFIWDTGIHIIDAINHVAGPLRLRPAETRRPQDHWRIAVFDGRDGATVILEIIPTGGQMWDERIQFFGDEYHVEIKSGIAPPWIVKGYHRGHLELDTTGAPDEPECISNGTYGETVAFLEAVTAGNPILLPNITEALASSELTAKLAN